MKNFASCIAQREIFRQSRNQRIFAFLFITYAFILGLSVTSYAQTLQWSQIVGPDFTDRSTSDNGFRLSRVITTKEASDGSLYVWYQFRYNDGISNVNFGTNNLIVYGVPEENTGGGLVLAKYSPSGNAVNWARVFVQKTLENDLKNADTKIMHLGFDINKSNGNASVALNISLEENLQVNMQGGITPNAIVATPFSYTTPATNHIGYIADFDSNGNLLYGSYMPSNSAYSAAYSSPYGNNMGFSFNNFVIANDGTKYLVQSFNGGGADQLPITSNAFLSAPPTGTFMPMGLTIFNSDNTVRYSSFYGVKSVGSSSAKLLSNGDLLVSFYGMDYSGTTDYVLPPPTTGPSSGLNYIMRVNKDGQVLSSRYLNGSDVVLAEAPNGDIAIGYSSAMLWGFTGTSEEIGAKEKVIEIYSSDLSTLKGEHLQPWASATGKAHFGAIKYDSYGRLHVLYNPDESTAKLPVSEGGLLGFESGSRASEKDYYAILDCDHNNIVYSTYLTNNARSNSSPYSNFRASDLEIGRDCGVYINGRYAPTTSFPLTPNAYDSNGNLVKGYKTRSVPNSNASDLLNGFVLKLNFPTIKSGTNVLETPATSLYCSDSKTFPIQGDDAQYITPEIIGSISDYVPKHYKWQRAVSASGPWTDLDNSDVRNYTAENPGAPGTYFFRRLVRQTPWNTSCGTPCDIEYASNAVELTFTAGVTHKTNLDSKPYGYCKSATNFTIPVDLTASTDGVFANYSYKLTTFSDLNTVVNNQSGTVTTAPGNFNLVVNRPGRYLLQVTDSRGCTSFDTLDVKHFDLQASSSTIYSCGTDKVQIKGILGIPEYANVANSTVSWFPSTGLDNPNITSPTIDFSQISGSQTYVLSLNGCPVDTVTAELLAPPVLSTLPDLELCQGGTVQLGPDASYNLPAGFKVTWAPGAMLTSNTVLRPTLIAASAPEGVNERTYTLAISNNSSGCFAQTTQKVTIYKVPNQSFDIKDCMSNDNQGKLGYNNIGTISEAGIGYSWEVVMLDSPAPNGTPTSSQILASLDSPNSSMVNLRFLDNVQGKAESSYSFHLIRTSFNLAKPDCVIKKDTANLSYCFPGEGYMCALALGSNPTTYCGGSGNIIAPFQYLKGGTVVRWARQDGQPILAGELVDPISGNTIDPLTYNSSEIIANPSGMLPVVYKVTMVNPGGDSCSVDITVFPAASSTPVVSYPTPQTACGVGNLYTIQGDAAIQGYSYVWEPSAGFVSEDELTKALPTLTAGNHLIFVTVTDEGTGCSVRDTVEVKLNNVAIDPGLNRTFCSAGETLNVGNLTANPSYRYSWTGPAGVSFSNASAAQTSVTLPATLNGETITLTLTVTDATGCIVSKDLILTSANVPSFSGGVTTRAMCEGSELRLGPITPDIFDYSWSGPGIVGAATGNSIIVNQVGNYTVTVGSGACTGTLQYVVTNPTPPTPIANIVQSCNEPTTIGLASLGTGYTFNWDKLTGLKSYANDFSTITVEPSVATTYTLTATHSTGCTVSFQFTVEANGYIASLPSALKYCEGQGNTTLPLNVAPSGAMYHWTVSPAAPLLSSTSEANPSINFNGVEAGTYTVSVFVVYTDGSLTCNSTTSTTVTIGKEVGQLAGPDRFVCSGSPTTLGLSVVSGTSYSWSSMAVDPSLASQRYSARPVVSPLVNTVYTLTYNGAGGCSYTDQVAVNVVNSPALEVMNVSLCRNDNGSFLVDLNTLVVSHSGTSLSFWQDEESLIASSSTVTSAGTYYIKSLNSNGCETIKPVIISATELPRATVVANHNCVSSTTTISIFSGGESQLRYAYSSGASYSGNATYATAASLGSATNVSGLNYGTYTIRVFSPNNGCYKDYMVISNDLECKVFDLALRKTIKGGEKKPLVKPGSEITYLITVFNQGNVDGENIEVVDYIPLGLTLNDTNWRTGTDTLGVGRAYLNTPITNLAAGESIVLEITFTVNTTAKGSVINAAEISNAENDEDLEDIDSTPDDNPGNDGTPKDDVTNENGKNGGDEDDHDIEEIEVENIFDLALRKTLTGGGKNPQVSVGDVVSFDITVFNQGNIEGKNIEVVDYLPVGLTLNDNNWTVGTDTLGVSRVYYNTPIASLLPGDSFKLTIHTTVSASATGVLVNAAEISKAENDEGLEDIDSTPDANPSNDGTPKDDVVNEDGTNGGDEDDHDIEQVTVTGPEKVFDLALKKMLSGGVKNPVVKRGSTVTFKLRVFNQGNVEGKNIHLVDYIPSGLTLNDPAWTAGTDTLGVGRAYLNTPIASLAAGDSVEVAITFTVSSTAEGIIINAAEISKAENDEGLEDIDSTPDDNPSNDGTPKDDVINEDGKKGGDEDDHDIETITICTDSKCINSRAVRKK